MRSRPSGIWQVTTLGLPAEKLLAMPAPLEMRGVTSRGAFVHTSGGVLFLSTENWRGPSTVNVEGDSTWLAEAADDTECSLGTGGLSLHPSGLQLRLEGALRWSAPERAQPPDLAHEQRARILQLTHGNGGPSVQDGLGGLAGWIAQGCPESSMPEHAQGVRCVRLHQAVVERDPARVASGLEGLLGWGPGLTPSGDDFIIGMLLALGRTQPRSVFSNELLEAATGMIEARAGGGTTAISASLLACAAAGEGDERLLALVDHIQTGEPGEVAARMAASSWGSTSGWDALAGISLAAHLVG
jgi:hypothetical protein